MTERADRTAAHFKQHPDMDLSRYSCDDVHFIKSVLVQSRKVSDNCPLELNQLRPVTAAACAQLSRVVAESATFRRKLIDRCLDEQKQRLSQAADKEALRRINFFKAELDVEPILQATVDMQMRRVCRTAR
jgi:hypothetical protein